MKSHKNSAGRLLLPACAISFVCFFGSYMRIPIVPLFASLLGADTVQVGMINGAFMLMAGALSIPSGLVSDRLGRRIPLLGGMILLAGSSILLYWSSSPLQMAVIYLLFGVGLSAFSPTLMSYVADVTPPEMLGQAYGWYTMALYGGMTLGPAAGGFLGTARGVRPVFLVAGGLIYAFDGSVTRLIQLYIMGVFTSFTLCQAGMVRHWNAEMRHAVTPAERRKINSAKAVNAFGAVLTGLVLVVVMITKFTHGAYLVVIAIPVLCVVMQTIHHHYASVRDELRIAADDEETLPSRVHAIVLVSGWNKATQRAVLFARASR